MKKQIRIKGLVKLANRVRQAIGQPISGDQLAKWKKTVEINLKNVDGLLAQNHCTINDLPAQSRNAYRLLKNANLDAITPDENIQPNSRAGGSVSFPGLRSYLEGRLDALATINDSREEKPIYQSIRETSEQIEKDLHTANVQSRELTTQSRDMRSWFGFFAEEDNFQTYIQALALARTVFTEIIKPLENFSTPVLFHFRPMKHLFRLHAEPNWTLVQLPTPMICFDKPLFESLANLAARKTKSKKHLLDAMQTEAYQNIISEFDLLGGATDNPSHTYIPINLLMVG